MYCEVFSLREIALLVAMQADCTLGKLLVFPARLLVDVMTRKARDIGVSIHYNTADVLHDVSVSGIQRLQMRVGPVDFQVAEQIIAGHKIIGIRETGTSRSTRPNMTLPAN